MAFSQRNYGSAIYGIPDSPRPIINSISVNYNNKIISGEYLTILANNHTKIVKPFIFVEGIDFLNNQDFPTHISLLNSNNYPYYNQIIKKLYDNGYDVIILDFDYSSDYLQNNAMLLVKLINDVYANNSLTNDNFVVMGYSMGGLIARYALTWMEANNQNHHTRLFVSHDAPQKGANFPLGLQEMIEDIKNNTAVAGIATNVLLTLFNSYAPAASQMLIYHYSNSNNGIARPSVEGVNFFSELHNLNPATNGYPAIPLKIASSNGNYSGFDQEFQPGDKILDFNYTKDNGLSWQICNLWQLIWNTCPPALPWAPDEISATVRAGFDGSQPIENFYIYSMGKHPIGNTSLQIPMGGSGEQTFYSNNYSYDNASGSYSYPFMGMLSTSIAQTLGVSVYSKYNTCFIPTISALDLNIGINEPFNLNSSQCSTNFDYIYANSADNIDHFTLTQDAENFIMSHVHANESPRQKYFFSDQNLNISANKIVNNNEQYNKTAKYTITNNAEFKINSGASSNLIAGQTIDLKPGFKVESGGLFFASIYNPNLLCGGPVQFVPRHLAPGLQPDPTGASIQKTYDCSNYSEIPNYNPDYNYFDCGIDSTQFSTESVDSIMNENITVFPNPTSGIMNIAITQEIPINNLVIRVYDFMSNLVYTVNPVVSYNMQFNLPNCIPGLMTVQFDFNNSIYIYNKKVIKN